MNLHILALLAHEPEETVFAFGTVMDAYKSLTHAPQVITLRDFLSHRPWGKRAPAEAEGNWTRLENSSLSEQS